jgi:uncharacterized protein with PQ loop repeat
MAHHAHKKHFAKLNKKDPIDYIIRFFMIITPLAELPQAITIYEQRSARDVSMVTWVFFAASSTAWLIYASRQKLLPLMVAYSLYLIIEISIVIGIIIYS